MSAQTFVAGAKRAEIVRRLSAGQSKGHIARSVPCSRWYVRNVASRLAAGELSNSSRSAVEWTPEMLSELEPFIHGFRSIHATAARIGVSSSAVCRGLAIVIRQERVRRARA